MDVKLIPARQKQNASESGQSLMEFVILLPVIIGFLIIMVRVNTAIQVSIVDQKYGRAQAIFIAQNSAVYPRVDNRQDMLKTSTNQLIMGVSNNSQQGDEEDEFSPDAFVPEAPILKITRNPAQARDLGPDKEEPDQRSNVRVRNTISMCTQSNVVKGGGGKAVPYTSANLKEDGFTPTSFLFCSSGTGVSLEPR